MNLVFHRYVSGGKFAALSVVRRYKYHAFSVYYPHSSVYNQYLIRGRINLPDSKNPSFNMMHPLFPSVSIEILNANRKNIDSIAVVKLKPLAEWLMPKSVVGEEDKTLSQCLDLFPLPLQKYIESSGLPTYEEVGQLFDLYDNLRPLGNVISSSAKYLESIPPSIKYRSAKLQRCTFPNEEEEYFYFIPDDVSRPAVKVDVRDLDALIEKYGITAKFFVRGKNDVMRRKDLRSKDIMAADLRKLIEKHNLAVNEFSDRALSELDLSLPSEEEIQSRQDFRDMCVFSIDPPTARDIDDALHIRMIDDDHFEVGIHIADVTHYIAYNGQLSYEAMLRGNSIYLGNEVIHMLPRELSEDLCSLHPGSPKLTLSVIVTMDTSGRVVGQPKLCKSVISSCAKLSYEQTDKILIKEDPGSIVINPPHNLEEVRKSVVHLHQLAKQMRVRRLQYGAMTIEKNEMLWTLEEEEESPVVMHTKNYGDSSKLIEEFMLLANISVAEFLMKYDKKKAFVRRHPEPMASKLNFLARTFQAIGVLRKKAVTSGELQKTMKKINETLLKHEDEATQDDYTKTLSHFYTKTMNLARYLPASSSVDLSHYGLAVPLYTHFTSPIRRYADMIVHYQLKDILDSASLSRFNDKALRRIAILCNEKRKATRNLSLDISTFHVYNIAEAMKGDYLVHIYVTGFNDTGFDFFCPPLDFAGKINLQLQESVISFLVKNGVMKVAFFPSMCRHVRVVSASVMTRLVCRFHLKDDMKVHYYLVSPKCIECAQERFLKTSDDEQAIKEFISSFRR